MIPYTIMLITQITLFAILSKTSQITLLTHGMFDEEKSIPTFHGELGTQYMIMFGSYPVLDELDAYQWWSLVSFTFLLNVLNLNLLISIIGATFDRVTHNQQAMNYRMKA